MSMAMKFRYLSSWGSIKMPKVMYWYNYGDTHFGIMEPAAPAVARVNPWWLAEGRNVYSAEVRTALGLRVLGDYNSAEEAKNAIELFLGVDKDA